ncbi:hypothetical protein TVAG_413750 [Trichomonas vaginalis G3]|uniref:Right handed beta helix domain-containing protein n=1 Tax=Trichomonas vaginalis (strain ATCC PRA-98 / G3) TaxID=412133 RepID=A2EC49_TRIV3|nr:pectin lyase-like family [Trichomonas vaginalis G3]EAY09726.1 hypothetical protein TVAG_413750 [Trichomonas vaginalis G3]KAI5550867.1 pectin lyase-like family [Trichomonas vaginalis G3]|eukprot:XP_001321949.1 hypothetical protein [Trichomonas vaginalis G3]
MQISYNHIKDLKSPFANELNRQIHTNNAAHPNSVKRKRYSNTKITLDSTRFDLCTSVNENGGSIFVENSQINLISCIFYKSSSNCGGAVYANGGVVTFEDCSAARCNSSDSGSAFYFNNTVVSVTRGFILKCYCEKSGSLYFHNSHITVKDVKLYENKAKDSLPGIVVIKSQGLVFGIYFNENVAENDQNGRNIVFQSTGEVIFEKSFFFGETDKSITYSNDCNLRIHSLVSESGYRVLFSSFEKARNVLISIDSFKSDLPPFPEPPFELDQEFFQWSLMDAGITYERIVIIGFIMLLIFLIIVFTIPKTIAHPIQEVMWDRI